MIAMTLGMGAAVITRIGWPLTVLKAFKTRKLEAQVNQLTTQGIPCESESL